MSNGHRWSKFWWQDWQNDKALNRCSLAARGLWMEMLCIAHEGEPYGHLKLNGQPLTAADIADMVTKTTEKEVVKLLAELEAKGVFSRTEGGTIYSRRMHKDGVQSDAGREFVARRWNGKSPHPPNRGAIRSPTSKPNGQAYSHPTSTPITQSTEAESEAEKERKKENLSLPSPCPAREAVAPASADSLAVKNILGRVARSLESSAKQASGKLTKLSIAEQQFAAVQPGPVDGEILPPDDASRPRRGPVDPVRTVAEQLAALGVPLTLDGRAA